MYRLVSLDAGGVIVNPNWQRVASVLRAHGVEADPAALEGAEPRAKRQFDSPPTISATNDAQRGWLYFNLVLEGAGIPLSKATDAALENLKAYHTQTNLWEAVTPGTHEALSELRARGLLLIVTSNANGRLHALLDRLDLSAYFDAIVDSYLEGVEKPDPRLFHIAVARAGARPEDAIHVGDLYHVDVAGARAAGLQPLLVDAGDLYAEADCPRIRSIAELPAYLRGLRSR
ncbi:MAG TPA: HAD-IA family hydrolase [Vicinamibacterales bacterium]|nr:HAD-IA family hydrolase [Vicinamibacterales bacterium]